MSNFKNMVYLILQNPGHNRVYYASADKLALAELKLAAAKLTTKTVAIKILEIENIRYLSLETKDDLAKNDINLLSKLSFVFAIFSLDKTNDQICLRPIRKIGYEYLDNKISSLLKYQGKTNELFTKMMINVGVLASDFNYDTKIKMLDPVAGKGTTLFEGAVYGFDVFGIEIEAKSAQETSLFFKKYLETERIKHNATKRQVYGTSKKDAVVIQEFDYANNKQDFKSPELVKKLGIVCGNTKDANKYFKKESFHLIIGDLPYGIVHGNSTDKRKTTITRNPSELLSDSLPEWFKVLKKGGIAIVAWNSFLASRQKLSGIFASHGFEVLSDAPFDAFEHMVDKSIKRDIVVAKKT